MSIRCGFTLVEVLVALTVFAVLGLAAHRFLGTLIDAKAGVSGIFAEQQSLILAVSRINRDLIQLYPRAVRDEYGEPLAPLLVQSGPYPLEFSRLGWRNPAGYRRSQVQRVAYQLQNEELQRLYWQVSDRGEDSRPRVQVLLAGVTSMRFGMLDAKARPHSVWPPPEELQEDSAPAPLLPLELEVILDTRSRGEVRKRVVLVDLPDKGDSSQGQQGAG